MSLKMCDLSREEQIANRSVVQLLDEKKKLETFIDSQGRNNVKQDVIELPKEASNSIKENEKLRVVETKVIFNTLTRVDTIQVKLTDTIVVEQEDTFSLKTFKYSDKWLSFAGKIQNDTISFDSLNVANQYSIEIGKERKWLLGKEKKVIYIRNENPHTNTTDVTSFVLNDEKKWYKRDGLKYAIGGLAVLLLVR
jgi:hypothetical protein